MQHAARQRQSPPDRVALARRCRVLVLAPTRELAGQIHESFRVYGSNAHLKSAVIYGGVGQRPQETAMSKGVDVLGVIASDPIMSAIKVSDLAERLGGKIISAHHKADRVVENFLIGTMQVENFLTHFMRHKNSAIIVGGDRSDVQLVALEGSCPCLILTGNLYPNDIILTRSEVLQTPIIMVREDTFSVAKKMENILSRHKLRDMIKVNHGVQLVGAALNFELLKDKLGL